MLRPNRRLLIPDVVIEGRGAFPAEIDIQLSDRSAPGPARSRNWF